MTPVIIGNAKLYNCDCMEYMATLPDKAFDLAIVDPPYGINVNHNMGRRAGNTPSDYKPVKWDSTPPSGLFSAAAARVKKPNRMGSKSFHGFNLKTLCMLDCVGQNV